MNFQLWIVGVIGLTVATALLIELWDAISAGNGWTTFHGARRRSRLAPTPPPPPGLHPFYAQAPQIWATADFFAHLLTMPAKHWESARLYVYRTAPKPVPAITGARTAYAAKYSEPINRKRIVDEHGTGEYMLILQDQRHRPGSRVAECRLTITHEDFERPPQPAPPIAPYPTRSRRPADDRSAAQ